MCIAFTSDADMRGDEEMTKSDVKAAKSTKTAKLEKRTFSDNFQLPPVDFPLFTSRF